MKTTKKRNKLAKKITLLIIFLSLLFFILLAIWLELPLHLKNISKEPQLIQIKDECSTILNQLIHQINDADACRIKCINECNFKKTSFYNSSFTFNKDSCNSCSCYCK